MPAIPVLKKRIREECYEADEPLQQEFRRFYESIVGGPDGQCSWPPDSKKESDNRLACSADLRTSNSTQHDDASSNSPVNSRSSGHSSGERTFDTPSRQYARCNEKTSENVSLNSNFTRFSALEGTPEAVTSFAGLPATSNDNASTKVSVDSDFSCLTSKHGESARQLIVNESEDVYKICKPFSIVLHKFTSPMKEKENVDVDQSKYRKILRLKKRKFGEDEHWDLENVPTESDNSSGEEKVDSMKTRKCRRILGSIDGDSPTTRRSSRTAREVVTGDDVCESPRVIRRSNQMARDVITSNNDCESPRITRRSSRLARNVVVGNDEPESGPQKNGYATNELPDSSDDNSEEDSFEVFRSPRKKAAAEKTDNSLLRTPTRTEVRSSPRSVRSSRRSLFPSGSPQVARTPTSSRPPKINGTPRVNGTPKMNVKSLTPSRGRIQTPLRTPTTPRDLAKHSLALSAAPDSLPCREAEFKTVYDFVRLKISSKESGVFCINGVPGSGKTATIHRVMKKLLNEVAENKLKKFKMIDVNAFDLRKSREIYRKIYEQLSGVRKPIAMAEQLLAERFETQKNAAQRVPIVLVIDEFDCLLAKKKRDVIYKMVEWQAVDDSQLVLLTIANKLDFSDEKKLFSRVKFEKLSFNAYSYKELEKIIANRLEGFDKFAPEAVQYIARKVAATSGDARKALDICRQVLDTVEAEDENFSFTIDYVGRLLEQVFCNPSIRIIRQLTNLEKVALRAVRDVLLQSEKSFCSLWNGVWSQFQALCVMEGIAETEPNRLLKVYAYLAAVGLLKLESDQLDQYSKIWLKCDPDVIQTALTTF